MSARKSKSNGHTRVRKRSKEEPIEEAQKEWEEGYTPSTAVGEFVHEEIPYAREGRHPVKNPKHAVAIVLSKACRAGIPLKPRKRRRYPPSSAWSHSPVSVPSCEERAGRLFLLIIASDPLAHRANRASPVAGSGKR